MNEKNVTEITDQIAEDKEAPSTDIGGYAAIISAFVFLSRITGFLRTWAIAFAVGATVLASSYQVANNLPNMLYELVMGGMLVTAFLPVYVSTKDKLGAKGGNEYASNLMSIAFIVLGVVALVCTILAPQLIYTQSFMSDQELMNDAIFFFRFFAIQILFYGMSTIVSGLLNASRDYLWSSAAPIFNNVIVTASFLLYAFLYPIDPFIAKLAIAIGNPLGVAVQFAIQIPALKKNGIKIRFHINLKDPALMETLSIGIPAIIVMFAGLVIVSVQNAAALSAVDNGPSVISYARLWFTLPYAFLVVPITTALFTEISEMYSQGLIDDFKHGITTGISQILFFAIPFAIYLLVFSTPLVTLYHLGAFTTENIQQIAVYLGCLAVSLPFYAVNTYIQKAFSALRLMNKYAVLMIVSALVQIVFTLVLATDVFSNGNPILGLPAVALGETVFYALTDVTAMVFLRKQMGGFGLSSCIPSWIKIILFGALGGIAATVVMLLLGIVLPLDGSIFRALVYIVIGGVIAVVVTYGPLLAANIEEAQILRGICAKFVNKIKRN